jgi:hypothetical protein
MKMDTILKMSKNLKCSICHLPIDPDKEFAKLTQYIKVGKKLKEPSYFHIQCYRDRLRGSKGLAILQTKAMGLLNKIGENLNG